MPQQVMIEDKTSYSTQNNILFSDISALLVVMQCPKIIQLKKKKQSKKRKSLFFKFLSTLWYSCLCVQWCDIAEISAHLNLFPHKWFHFLLLRRSEERAGCYRNLIFIFQSGEVCQLLTHQESSFCLTVWLLHEENISVKLVI